MMLRAVRPAVLILLTSSLMACDEGPTSPPTDSLACNTTVGTVSIGDSVTGVLTPESCRFADGTRADRWRLVLAAPAIITIDMISDDVDPFLIVRDEDGFLIAQDDEGGGSPNARITHGFAAGTYYISANTYYRDEFGGYSLIVE
jgi:hypothetical protein